MQDIRRLVSNGNDYGNYFELPTMNHKYQCKSYRFSYGISAARPTNIANAISKVWPKDALLFCWALFVCLGMGRLSMRLYAYGSSVSSPCSNSILLLFKSCMQHDHELGTSKLWVNGDGGSAGEPKFIPRPGKSIELHTSTHICAAYIPVFLIRIPYCSPPPQAIYHT